MNSEIIEVSIKHFVAVLYDRFAVHYFEPEYSSASLTVRDSESRMQIYKSKRLLKGSGRENH